LLQAVRVSTPTRSCSAQKMLFGPVFKSSQLLPSWKPKLRPFFFFLFLSFLSFRTLEDLPERVRHTLLLGLIIEKLGGVAPDLVWIDRLCAQSRWWTLSIRHLQGPLG
jgi:hypothetical protein